MDVDILLFDGFDELDAVGPFEVLTSARDLGAPFDVALVGAENGVVSEASRGVVTAAHGLRVVVDRAAGSAGRTSSSSPAAARTPAGRSARGRRSSAASSRRSYRPGTRTGSPSRRSAPAR